MGSKTPPHLTYGTGSNFRSQEQPDGPLGELRLLPLYWSCLRLDTWDGWPEILVGKPGIESPGVYAFEGWLDSQGARSVLYIGQAGGKAGRPLRARLADGKASSGWFGESHGSQLVSFSHVMDLVVRWAPVSDASLVDEAEAALIAGHSPAFNSRDVKNNVSACAAQLVVLNCGSKGRLLPAVVGAYYTNERGIWPSPPPA